MPGASGSGGGISTSLAIAAPGTVAHWLTSGPAHTALATRPPGFTHSDELVHCLLDVRDEHEREPGAHAVEARVGERKVLGATLLIGDVRQTLRSCPPLRSSEHLGRDVGQRDVTLRGPA